MQRVALTLNHSLRMNGALGAPLAAAALTGALALLPSQAQALTLQATLWMTVSGPPTTAMGSVAQGDVIRWNFDIIDTPVTTNTTSANRWSVTSLPLQNLTGTVYNGSDLTSVKGVFGGTYKNTSSSIEFRATPNPSPFPSSSVFLRFIFGDSTGPAFTNLTFPGGGGALNQLAVGATNLLQFDIPWQQAGQPGISTLSAQNIFDNGFYNQTLTPVSQTNIASMSAATEQGVTLNVNSLRISVPGPLPVMGAFSAFAYSRRIKKRILTARSKSAV